MAQELRIRFDYDAFRRSIQPALVQYTALRQIALTRGLLDAPKGRKGAGRKAADTELSGFVASPEIEELIQEIQRFANDEEGSEDWSIRDGLNDVSGRIRAMLDDVSRGFERLMAITPAVKYSSFLSIAAKGTFCASLPVDLRFEPISSSQVDVESFVWRFFPFSAYPVLSFGLLSKERFFVHLCFLLPLMGLALYPLVRRWVRWKRVTQARARVERIRNAVLNGEALSLWDIAWMGRPRLPGVDWSLIQKEGDGYGTVVRR
ncbi:hypothetical protein BJ508DRAFT_366380 [Ascobolus immersus RN42]|uniref:Uncharacterized protein n=1 Tax=Ascobolus immersus RN42 TaxID=1160509 RepID=A0A3N4HQQ7_ASCIM|nr:hypothetical protein BJ508DRAFT_366380 [Ascobolus immersus RN42]